MWEVSAKLSSGNGYEVLLKRAAASREAVTEIFFSCFTSSRCPHTQTTQPAVSGGRVCLCVYMPSSMCVCVCVSVQGSGMQR